MLSYLAKLVNRGILCYNRVFDGDLLWLACDTASLFWFGESCHVAVCVFLSVVLGCFRLLSSFIGLCFCMVVIWPVRLSVFYVMTRRHIPMTMSVSMFHSRAVMISGHDMVCHSRCSSADAA